MCDGCGGMFVTEHELNGMLAAADGADPRTLDDWPATGPSDRLCPLCAHAMVRVNMESVPVERCTGHGVWFDAGELKQTLSPEREDGVPQIVRAVWDSMKMHRVTP